MNTTVILAKRDQLLAGLSVIMSDAELDWLADNDQHPKDVVSIRNPNQVGTLDTYQVAHKDHPAIRAERAKQDLLTSATRSSMYQSNKAWDEPAGASTPRGWYWPKASTTPGKTLCAGHYLDYTEKHKRYDDRQETEPGNIHCVVVSKETGRCVAWRYVETVEAARAFIETEAAKFGHKR